jgi:hypothetical protein
MEEKRVSNTIRVIMTVAVNGITLVAMPMTRRRTRRINSYYHVLLRKFETVLMIGC